MIGKRTRNLGDDGGRAPKVYLSRHDISDAPYDHNEQLERRRIIFSRLCLPNVNEELRAPAQVIGKRKRYIGDDGGRAPKVYLSHHDISDAPYYHEQQLERRQAICSRSDLPSVNEELRAQVQELKQTAANTEAALENQKRELEAARIEAESLKARHAVLEESFRRQANEKVEEMEANLNRSTSELKVAKAHAKDLEVSKIELEKSFRTEAIDKMSKTDAQLRQSYERECSERIQKERQDMEAKCQTIELVVQQEHTALQQERIAFQEEQERFRQELEQFHQQREQMQLENQAFEDQCFEWATKERKEMEMQQEHRTQSRGRAYHVGDRT